jgi:NTE family protein
MIEPPPSATPQAPSMATADGPGAVAPLLAQLRALPLFADLPDAVVGEVAAEARRRVVRPGEVLCRVGEPGDAFYVVDSGMVRVLVPTPRGEELVAQLGPGHWFGEMALITGEPRSATVIAAVETTLMVLERRAFQALMQRAPHAMMVISDTLSRRLRAHLLAGPPAVRPHTIVAVAPPTAEARRVLLNVAVALYEEMRTPVVLLDAPPEGAVPDGVTVQASPPQQRFETVPLIVARVDPERQGEALPVPHPDAVWVLGGCDAGPLLAAHPGISASRIDWSGERPWVHTQRTATFDRSVLADPAVVRSAPHSPVAAALRRFARITARRRVGIAFSAGGARGIAHVGALRCLERAGIEFDMIVGTSMGAIIGGGVAYGMTSANLYDLLREIALHPRRTLLDFGVPHASILRGRKKSEIFRRQGPSVRFEDLPTPFWAVAADLVSGRECVLSSGIVWQAVDASTAIPGIFPPVQIDGHRFVDGWIVNSLPADVLRREGADTVLAVCVSAGRQGGADDPPPPSLPDATGWRARLRRVASPTIGRNLLTAIDIGARERTLANLALVDVCITPELKGMLVSDFRRLDELVERGETAAEAALPAIRAAVAGQRS